MAKKSKRPKIKRHKVDIQEAARAGFAAMTDVIAKQAGGLVDAHSLFHGALHVMAMTLALQTEGDQEYLLSVLDEQVEDLIAKYMIERPKPVSEH
jgi:hypothetical protein